jgi:hypothetical protein
MAIKKINYLAKKNPMIGRKRSTTSKTSKETTKWYSTPSIIISIVALSSTLVFNAVNYNDKITENRSKSIASKIETVNSSIDELLNIQEKNLTTPNNLNLSVTYNVKRRIVFEKLIRQVNEVKEHISPDAFSIIGEQYLFDGNFEEALKAYQEQIKAVHRYRQVHRNKYDFTYEIVAFRNLGYIFHIKETPFYNLDSAQHYRSLSVSECKNIKGEAGLSYKGVSYYYWALSCLNNGEQKLANTLLDSAYITFGKLSPANSTKSSMLLQVEGIKTNNETNKNSIFDNVLGGIWTGRFPDNGKTYDLKAYITFNNFQANVSIDIFDGQTLVQQLSGFSRFSDRNRLIFNLQGFRAYRFPNQIGGTLILTENSRVNSSIKLAGEISFLNEAPVTFVLRKV